MVIYFGADHRGFKLKEYLKNFLKNQGYEVVDVGNYSEEADDDYPDFARKVAEKVSLDYEQSRGVLICGSGMGMDIVANKFARVRSALAAKPDQAYDSRNENDSNVLTLAADYLEPETAKKILKVWLTTPFSREERHRRRLQEISELEREFSRPIIKEENDEEE